jgi:hypothetical protein
VADGATVTGTLAVAGEDDGATTLLRLPRELVSVRLSRSRDQSVPLRRCAGWGVTVWDGGGATTEGANVGVGATVTGTPEAVGEGVGWTRELVPLRCPPGTYVRGSESTACVCCAGGRRTSVTPLRGA